MTSATPLPRDDFPVTTGWTYLDHAGVSPLPQSVTVAVDGYLRRLAAEGGAAYERASAAHSRVRARTARLLGVSADEVAFVKNTTEGLGFVASGLELGPGDRVVVPDREFPSAIFPWLALRDRGVTVDLVAPRGPSGRLPVEAFAEVIAAGPAPTVVAVSWVQFSSGWRTDLAALADVCHAAGGLLVVDVIQGLGVIPAELGAWGVDAAAAGAHKWLLGPMGIGVLYVRRAHLDRLRVLEPGWASVPHRTEWDNLTLAYDDTARRLEGGTLNMLGLTALGAATDMLLDAEVAAVWDHVTALCDRACARLTEIGATILSDRSVPGRSAIVVFTVDGTDPRRLAAALRDRGIVCAPRGGGIRMSPHGYNTAAEIDHLVDTVAELTA